MSVKAREIIDSRGNPTVEVLCELSSGAVGCASVPSGASTGSHEALELRDHDLKRYNGLGVLAAVGNVQGEINDYVRNKEFDQAALDAMLVKLDETPNKTRLGANAILGVSLAFARARAQEEGLPLYRYLGALSGRNTFAVPQPMFNIINGGKHADSGLDIQEYMIVPSGIDSFKEKIRAAAEIIAALKNILKSNGYSTSVGDEGGFAPKLSSNEEACELILQAISAGGYSTDEIKISIDAAATSFYSDGWYRLKIAGEEKSVDSAGLLTWYETLVAAYPIISIEDGFAEEDWQGFSNMTATLGSRINIVGDDLLVTNESRIAEALQKKAVNAAIIKPNQVGTLTETLRSIACGRAGGLTLFASHRSGETTDTFIADLAVGLSCEYMKSGSLARGERVCKYNRLMEIEETLKGCV